jgi:hypothetical protein
MTSYAIRGGAQGKRLHEPAKSLALSTLVNIADAVLAEELATSAEIDAALAALNRYTEDPRSLVSGPRIFQVWGRRAATPP